MTILTCYGKLFIECEKKVSTQRKQNGKMKIIYPNHHTLYLNDTMIIINRYIISCQMLISYAYHRTVVIG